MIDEKSKILFCEENENLGVLISEYLNSKNFNVDFFQDRDEAYKSFVEHKHTMCILDITLFINGGFELIDKIHAENPLTYIIFLIPKRVRIDRAFHEKETFLPKPFSINDLVSVIKFKSRSNPGKIKDTRRIYEPVNTTVYSIGKYSYEVQRRRLILNDDIIQLTSKESALLTILCENANTIIDRNVIIEAIWDYEGEYYGKSRTMDVYICKIRNYLRGDDNINLVNIHGKGYKFIIPVSKQAQLA
ncbi:MAG TPA: response regulator transcription factor [Paludibacter sp.]|nr:response regulator transcription factor [Paludibacter sp.]